MKTVTTKNVFAKTVLLTALLATTAQPAFADKDSIANKTGEVLGQFFNGMVSGATPESLKNAGAVTTKAAGDRAAAELSGKSTQITGDVTIDVTAKNVTSIASGNDSVSDIKIGTIGASQLKDVEITVDVGDVTSVASGNESMSFIKIGTIENSKIDGTAKITVKAENITSIASGDKSFSSIAMGSIY